MELLADWIIRTELKDANVFEGLKKSLVIEALKVCPIFRIDNVAEYYWTNEQDYWEIGKDFPNIAPPFKEFWMEYRMPERIHTSDAGYQSNPLRQRWGFLFMAEDEGKTKLGDARWLINVISLTGLDQKTIGGASLNYWYGVAKDGRLGNVGRKSMYGYACDPEFQKHFSVEQIHQMGCFIHPALLAISFLHCKNVEIVSAGRTPGVHHRQRHRGTKHYVLSIEPLKGILRREGQSEKTGLKMALHICRGHFKDFSKGSGLFGKFKGMYWWGDQVRGSKEEGEVIKQYKVKPPKA
jgi:hypothetical protein